MSNSTITDRRLPLVALCLGLAGPAGCGGNADVRAFAEACEGATNLGAAACTCMGEKARDELSTEGRTFLIATMRKDVEAAEAARRKLSFPEAMAAGMFLTKAAACQAPAPDAGTADTTTG